MCDFAIKVYIVMNLQWFFHVGSSCVVQNKIVVINVVISPFVLILGFKNRL